MARRLNEERQAEHGGKGCSRKAPDMVLTNLAHRLKPFRIPNHAKGRSCRRVVRNFEKLTRQGFKNHPGG